ncbi:extracellular solute-binding protein [Salibacterium salarium]|uniref:Extracellular solute-binding protein n=1 Tax=Salibacterium salarium TaxID=284579 RepID=A0A3R9P9R3_9BACI|nr:extracellular solute-binding protein [Salibacterium salarium]RSL33539.1 extracellular solute-binding protein [Salibacterium salarium]
MKSKNSKTVYSTFIVLTTVAALTACGNSDSSGETSENNTDEAVNLEYFIASEEGNPDYEVFMESVEQFDQEHSDINLQVESVSHNDYSTRLTTQAAGGELPDMFQITPISALQNIVESGSAGSIDNIKDHWIDNGLLTEESFDEFTIDGSTYALPLSTTPTQFIYYDEDMLAEVGYDSFPESYDEFIALINDLNDAGTTPISLGNSSPWVLQSVYISGFADRFTGSDFLNQVMSGEKEFTDPEFVDALEIVEELVEIEAFNEDFNTIDNEQMVDQFMQGNSAMMIDGNWSASTVSENKPEDKNIGIASMPLGDTNSIPTTMGTVSSINSDLSGEKREAAELFLKEVYDKEVFEGFLSLGIPVPSDIEIPEDELDPLSLEMIEITQESEPAPVYDAVLSTGLIDTMENGLQSITIGEATPEEVAEEVQAEVQVEE